MKAIEIEKAIYAELDKAIEKCAEFEKNGGVFDYNSSKPEILTGMCNTSINIAKKHNTEDECTFCLLRVGARQGLLYDTDKMICPAMGLSSPLTEDLRRIRNGIDKNAVLYLRA